MQYEIDNYILEYIEVENKYYISFLDSVNNKCRLEITEEIFDAYMTYKKCNTKMEGDTRRHIEYLDLTEEQIYNKLKVQPQNMEDRYLKSLETNKIRKALDTLTDTQYRRIMLHSINKYSIRDIAKIENVTKNQIEKSIKLGNKKIKKFLEN